jgi:SAM-dependent methyltransferase
VNTLPRAAVRGGGWSIDRVRNGARHAWDRLGHLLRKVVFLATVPPLRRYLRGRRGATGVPPVGLVRFGDLRRLDPISRDWGDDRGGPVDRYYIESFLAANRSAIRGRTLEIAEDVYTRWFGGSQVSQVDILEYRKGEHPRATFVGDLTSAESVPSDTFDCVIVTQTLQLIYDVGAAVSTIHRILQPGGVALVTLPGITQINRHDRETWGDYWCWNFTALSARRLFTERFPGGRLQVETHGNVLTAASFLYGIGRGELTRRELDHHDPDYEVLITVRAEKATAS